MTEKHSLKITEIKVTPLRISAAPRDHVIHSINPIYRFPDLKYGAPGQSLPGFLGQLLVQVKTDEGLSGISAGGYAVQGATPLWRTYYHLQ